MVPFGFARALSFKLGALKWLVWLARGVPSRAQRVNSSNTRIDKANSRVSPLFLYIFRQNGKKRVKSNATNSHHRWQFVITSGGANALRRTIPCSVSDHTNKWLRVGVFTAAPPNPARAFQKMH